MLAPEFLAGAYGITGILSTAITSVLTSVTSSVLSGGSPQDGFRAGFKSLPLMFARAALAYKVGSLFEDSSVFGELFKNNVAEARAIAHGLSNGAIESARGGNFGTGFLSGLAAGLGETGGRIEAIVLGGTASALSGGKFADGALIGALTYSYNCDMHNCDGSSSEMDEDSQRDINELKKIIRLNEAEKKFDEANFELFEIYERIDRIETSLELSLEDPTKSLIAKPKIGFPLRSFPRPSPSKIILIADLVNVAFAEATAAYADHLEHRLIDRLRSNGTLIGPYFPDER